MDNQITRELNQHEPDFLEKAEAVTQGRQTYVCPVCRNGTGSSGTGIVRDPKSDKNRYKCFKCGFYGDIFDLWKRHLGINDNKEAYKSLCQHYGLPLGGAGGYQAQNQNQPKTEQYTHNNIHTEACVEANGLEAERQKNNAYYTECRKHISETDYLVRRGLSDEVVNRFCLGYDPNYRKNTGGKAWKAIIIPTGDNSYIVRNTDRQADKQNRYRKVGESRIFNEKALRHAKKPVFICEGELDALSIIEVGGEAVGLGSTANVHMLARRLASIRPTQTLVLALDNDDSGQKATKVLEQELKKLKLPFYRCNPYGDKKDANDALLADRDAFMAAIYEAERKEAEELEVERQEYLKTSVANHLKAFIEGIQSGVNTPFIPTGFPKLDGILDGGLYEGLYIVGAISSLGKTTLITQIVDQIAQGGNDVLIFSLEMARTEIMAKSISRHTLLLVLAHNGRVSDAKTTRGITTYSRYANYSSTEIQLIQEAVKAYSGYAEHIYINEGIGDIGVEQVREQVTKHIQYSGRKPVVVIDYLQILAPVDVRATDKQNTDKVVLELKRISRDFKIPVIGISSFNRQSYKEEVDMAAFKESGAIEYSSDVLIGLQLKGAGSGGFNATEAKAKNPREVDLVVLKNRNGETGRTVSYSYYPMFNYFKEEKQ